MFLDLLKIINHHEVEKFDDSLFNEPATEEQILNLVNESIDKLQYEPCDGYLDLLRLTDGYDNCNDDGVDFFSVEEFVDMNRDWQINVNTKDFIIFGSSASAPIYAFNIKKRIFSIADRYYFSEKHDKIFDTFDDMISSALRPRVNELTKE